MCVVCVWPRLPPRYSEISVTIKFMGFFFCEWGVGWEKIGERLSMKRGRFLPALDSLNFISYVDNIMKGVQELNI